MLADSGALTNLVTLGLPDTLIGDTGACVLLDSTYLTRLCWLRLDGSKVSEPVWQAVQQAVRERRAAAIASVGRG